MKQLPFEYDVVVPVFNKADLTHRFLLQTLAFAPEAHIILVDDGSTDSTPALGKMIESFGHKYIKHDVNKGPHAAWDTGLQASTQNVVIVANNDIIFSKTTLRALAAYALKYNFAVCLKKERVDFQFGDLHDGTNPLGTFATLYPSPHLSKGALFSMSKTIKNNFPIDTRMRMAYADIDLEQRILKAGYTGAVIHNIIFHIGSATRDSEVSVEKDVHQCRADFEVFAEKWMTLDSELVKTHTPINSVEEELRWKIEKGAKK